MWKEVSISRDFVNELSKGDVVRFNGEWTGAYQNSASTGEGLRFDYFLNESAEYRITLLIDSHDPDFQKVDINSTDGGHETLVMMEDVSLVEVDVNNSISAVNKASSD